MKLAMIRVYELLKKEKMKSKMILQVHDELLIETVPEEKDRVYQKYWNLYDTHFIEENI